MNSEYGIDFNSEALFLIPNFNWVKTVTIFSKDNGSSTHAINRKKYVLAFGEGLTQRLDKTAIILNRLKYSINFTRSKNKFCLSLHYNRSNSFL